MKVFKLYILKNEAPSRAGFHPDTAPLSWPLLKHYKNLGLTEIVAMFADVVKMTMLTDPPSTCASANTSFTSSNLSGGYFCPATLNGAQVFQYVQGENKSFKQRFGPDEKSKSEQYCANIPGVGVTCSTYVPCGASYTADDLNNMKGGSCGCAGFKYCANGVGSNVAAS